MKSQEALVPKRPSVEPEHTGMWRWIVELSIMSNNEEAILHNDHGISYDEFRGSELRRRLAGDFRDPMLVLSRPVFAVEVAAGLDVSYQGMREKESPPKITKTLDGLYRFLGDVEHCRQFFEAPTQVIANIVANNYYNCMSGGMDRTCVRACRAVVKQYDCDLNEPVYPGKKKDASPIGNSDYSTWYTLGDWMKETEDEAADAEFLRDAGPLIGRAFPTLPPASER